jgi:hypothetical protein
MSTEIIEIETLKCDGCFRNQRDDQIEFADSFYFGPGDTTELCKECAERGYYICTKCGSVHAYKEDCTKFPEKEQT